MQENNNISALKEIQKSMISSKTTKEKPWFIICESRKTKNQ